MLTDKQKLASALNKTAYVTGVRFIKSRFIKNHNIFQESFIFTINEDRKIPYDIITNRDHTLNFKKLSQDKLMLYIIKTGDITLDLLLEKLGAQELVFCVDRREIKYILSDAYKKFGKMLWALPINKN